MYFPLMHPKINDLLNVLLKFFNTVPFLFDVLLILAKNIREVMLHPPGMTIRRQIMPFYVNPHYAHVDYIVEMVSTRLLHCQDATFPH